MRKFFKKNLSLFWESTVVILAIILPWFWARGCLFFTDFTVGPADIAPRFFEQYFIFPFLFESLKIVFSACVAQKVLIGGALLVTLFGGWNVARQLVEGKLAFFISLFSLFNPFIYDRLLYGQVSVVYAFGFLCVGIGFLVSYAREHILNKVLYAGVFLGLAVQFSSHFIFIVGCIGLALFFVHSEKKNNLREVIFEIFLFIIIIIIINANWIIGIATGQNGVMAFVSEGISKADIVAFQTAGKTGGEVLENVLMMSGFWGKEQFRYADLTQAEGWGRGFWFLVPLILWGVYVGLKNKETRRLSTGLVGVFVVAVTLAVGIRLPVAREITYWMFDNVPFYKGMRETQKWVAAIVPVYGIFLAFGIKELFKLKYVDMNQKVASLFLGGVIIMQAPLLLWGFGGQVRPVEYPADWYEVDAMIQQESNCEGKILFLPWHLYMSFGWVGNIVANPANKFFTCPVIQGTNMEFGGIYDNSTNLVGKKVGEWITAEGGTDLLSDTSEDFQYIILAKEVDWEVYLWIESLRNIVLIKETDTLKIYKIE